MSSCYLWKYEHSASLSERKNSYQKARTHMEQRDLTSAPQQTCPVAHQWRLSLLCFTSYVQPCGFGSGSLCFIFPHLTNPLTCTSPYQPHISPLNSKCQYSHARYNFVMHLMRKHLQSSAISCLPRSLPMCTGCPNSPYLPLLIPTFPFIDFFLDISASSSHLNH